MNTLDAIAKRQSCRSYSGGQITEEQLSVLLKAANAAPVGMGRYENVKLTVIQNGALLSKLDQATAELMNRPGAHPIYGAPTLIVVAGKKQDGPMASIAYCDAACVMENMMLAATDLGLGCVYLAGAAMAIGASKALSQEAKLPDDFMPVAVMAVGTPAAPLQERTLSETKIAVDYIR